MDKQPWLALMIGNSRLHWAWVECHPSDDGNSDGSDRPLWPKLPVTIQRTWDTPHVLVPETIPGTAQETRPELSPATITPELETTLKYLETNHPSLVIASVVPHQTTTWQMYPNTKTLNLADIPLTHLYPTLGIDRALAVLGAWSQWQRPVLVIDGGTALTFTGVNQRGELIGGAILPGLGLQLRSLHQHTAALPNTWIETVQTSHWASNTPDAIRSGIWHTLLAGIRDFIWDWQTQFPNSTIIFTGGDGNLFYQAMHPKRPNAPTPQLSLTYDPHIIFKGMAIAHLAS